MINCIILNKWSVVGDNLPTVFHNDTLKIMLFASYCMAYLCVDNELISNRDLDYS